MPRLLVVHHTPSPNLQTVLEAVKEGAAMVDEIDLVLRPALSAGAADLLRPTASCSGRRPTSATCPGRSSTSSTPSTTRATTPPSGLPFGVYVHGGDDTAGALTSIERITTALRWKQVAAPLSLTGPPTAADLEAVTELAATVAVSL